MASIIPTIYHDQIGSVETEISNDDKLLTLIIEGVTFTSYNFDDFSPPENSSIPSRFKLDQYGDLTDCTLSCKIPLIVREGENDVVATLDVDFYLAERKGVDVNYGKYQLNLNGRIIEIGKREEFESVFDIIESKLDANTYARCCYNCLYADYSPFGSDVFGSMLCFKNMKKQYIAVRTKQDFIDIMTDSDGAVQETFLCNDFEKRIKGTGYRG